MAPPGRFESRKDPYAVIAHYYDAEHDHLTEDIVFYRELVEITGPYVLDMGCGTARVGLALAADGKFVIGIDSSDTMLAIANGKLRSNRVPLELRRLDMRELNYSGQFDVVVCALDSFSHLLTIEDQIACLRGVGRALKPHGVLALDVLNPSTDRLAVRDGVLMLQAEFDSASNQPTKHFVAWRVNYESQIIGVDHIYDAVNPDGGIKRRQSTFDVRYVYRFELELLLRSAGLALTGIYSDYRRSPYQADGDRMVVVATRAG